MIPIAYDFHIHSCLSPCADNDMTPENIIGMAFIKGLSAIAITDHNSCRHCELAIEIGEKYGIIVIPGMELNTKEEVHVLCLFKDIEAALLFEDYVQDKLYQIKNKPEIFGRQIIVGKEDKEIGEVEHLLIQATDISFHEVYHLTKQYGGIMIPAHIDKNSNSLLSNLGFIPLDSQFSCVEIKDATRKEELLEKHPYLRTCNCISNSDAHSLGNINEAINVIFVDDLNRKEILKELGRR